MKAPRAIAKVLLLISAVAVCGHQTHQKRPEPTPRIQAAIDAALKLPEAQRAKKLAEISKLAGQISDIPGEISALIGVAKAQWDADRFSEALSVYHSALTLSRTSGDRFFESDVLLKIGELYVDRQQFAQAGPWFAQALSTAKEAGYRLGVADAATDAATVDFDLGQVNVALPQFENALKIYEELNVKSGVAQVQTYIGNSYFKLGQNDKAESFLESAFQKYTDLKNLRMVALIQMDIGNIYLSVGKYNRALVYYQEALKTNKTLKLTGAVANVQTNIGKTYIQLGEYEKALPYLESALKTDQESKLPMVTAIVETSIGSVYEELGQSQKALHLYQVALRGFQNLKLQTMMAIVQRDIGDVYYELGKNELALNFYQQAQNTYLKLKLSADAASIQAQIGIVYNETGRSRESLLLLEAALRTFLSLRQPTEVAWVRRNLGSVHQTRGELADALANYLAASPFFEFSGDRTELAQADLGIARTYDSLGLPEVAVLFGKQAINLYQSLRRNTAKLSPEIRKSYLETMSGAYRSVADMLIKQGRIIEAERVLGLLKDDERYDFLRRDPGAKSVVAEVEFVGREKGWLDKWKAVEGRAVSVAATVRDLEEKAAKAQREGAPFKDEAKLRATLLEQDVAEKAMAAYFDALKAEIADHVKIHAEIRQKEIDAFRNQVQGPLRRLEASVRTRIAAVYGLDYEGYAHFIVATPVGEAPISVKVDLIRLNTAIADLRAALTDPNKDPKAPGKALYDLVLAKPIGQLHDAGVHHVMWSLDGALRYIPLAAVWNGKNYLVETDSFSGYSPLELEKLNAERASSPRVEAFGASRGGKFKDRSFPPLPNVKREVDSVVKNSRKGAYGVIVGDPWLDSEFTASTFLTQMSSDYYRISHIASHFDLRGDFARSALLTGDQKLLSLRDILGSGSTLDEAMRRKPWAHLDLVVLSACDTAEATTNLKGQDDQSAGAETESFASVVLGLGASSVMASLWSVSDKSTSMLMSRFYRNWVSGMTKAEALRSAQISMLHPKANDVLTKSPRRSVSGTGGAKAYKPLHPYDHPYYWAPFVLYGNWR